MGEGGIGERETLHRGLALEQDPRLLFRQRTIGARAEGRLDSIDRSLLDPDLTGVESAVDRRARKRSGDRGVEVQFSDRGRARNGAGVDLEIKQAIRRPFAFKVEPRGGRYEMQAAGQGDARIVVELDVALERRVAGEDRLDDAWRKPLEARVEIERQLARCALPRNDHLPVRPHIRACVEVELRGEIVERARAIEGELDRRQAGKIGEMGKNTAGGLGGVHVERELVGRGNVSQQRFEIARRVEPLRGQRQVEALGRRPERRLAGNAEASRDADHRLAKRELLHAELLDEHLDRQFRQDRLLRARVRRRSVRGKRAAQKLHAPDRELVDFEPPAEQSQPVPDEPSLVDLEPRALAVGDDDVADCRVGGQHAVHGADGHAHSRRRQSARDQIGEDALVLLRRMRARAKGEEGDQRQSFEAEQELRHQKDCPMLT